MSNTKQDYGRIGTTRTASAALLLLTGMLAAGSVSGDRDSAGGVSEKPRTLAERIIAPPQRFPGR